MARFLHTSDALPRQGYGLIGNNCGVTAEADDSSQPRRESDRSEVIGAIQAGKEVTGEEEVKPFATSPSHANSRYVYFVPLTFEEAANLTFLMRLCI